MAVVTVVGSTGYKRKELCKNAEEKTEIVAALILASNKRAKPFFASGTGFFSRW